jgi:hypothetical protein
VNALQDLFRGIAVVIDDQVHEQASEIGRLMAQIEGNDCHVIPLVDLPSDAKLDTLSEAAFFILDWKLHDVQRAGETGEDVPLVMAPRGLEAQYIAANVEFLKKIRKRRFAPIFIFTNEDADSIKRTLGGASLFTDSPSDFIFVQNKAAVLHDGVFQILAEWIKGHPSAYVLKRWESAYATTRNAFFVDFYLLSHLWPVVLWKTYTDDKVSEAAELTSMISRNIVSRLAPVPFDAEIVAGATNVEEVARQVKAEEVRKVLEGERFVRDDQLQSSVSVGDVFRKGGEYFVNVRPECDCVARGDGSTDDIQLYLIRGDKVTDSKFHKSFNSELGCFNEKDTTGTVFAMYDGVTVCFQFQDLRIEKWGAWKDKRIGRLIPPYSTRLLQRFGAFIQRVGLARIPEQAVPKKSETAGGNEVVLQQRQLSEYPLRELLHALFSGVVKHVRSGR